MRHDLRTGLLLKSFNASLDKKTYFLFHGIGPISTGVNLLIVSSEVDLWPRYLRVDFKALSFGTGLIPRFIRLTQALGWTLSLGLQKSQRHWDELKTLTHLMDFQSTGSGDALGSGDDLG